MKDPELGFLDEDVRFVYDEVLTKKLYNIFRENNIDLQLRESPTVLEVESSRIENKG